MALNEKSWRDRDSRHFIFATASFCSSHRPYVSVLSWFSTGGSFRGSLARGVASQLRCRRSLVDRPCPLPYADRSLPRAARSLPRAARSLPGAGLVGAFRPRSRPQTGSSPTSAASSSTRTGSIEPRRGHDLDFSRPTATSSARSRTGRRWRLACSVTSSTRREASRSRARRSLARTAVATHSRPDRGPSAPVRRAPVAGGGRLLTSRARFGGRIERARPRLARPAACNARPAARDARSVRRLARLLASEPRSSDRPRRRHKIGGAGRSPVRSPIALSRTEMSLSWSFFSR